MSKKTVRKLKKETLICYILMLIAISIFGWQVYKSRSAWAAVEAEIRKAEYIGTYTITAYCGCRQCCGSWSSTPVIGSGNVPLYEGTHVAAHLPNGTKIYIDGIGNYEVQDTPAPDYNVIDIYFESHQAAEVFGTKTAKVYLERVKL